MTLEPCPDVDSLELLLLGKLSAAECENLGEHLLNCQQCAATVDTINASDDLTAALASRQVYHGDEEILALIIDRSKKLRAEIETVQTKETRIVGQSENDVAAGSEPVDDDIDFLAPAENPDEIGRLGGYRVLEVVGVGGMSVVFRAEDPKLKRLIALKAMKPAMAATRSSKERFLREAQSTASIEHDNIVHIYQVGEDRNVPFIAMQFLRGESLQKRLKREKKLDQREVLRIGREIATGLAAAHARDLFHRDIKPDNIWIEEESGRVKILDFGLARTASNDAGLTQSGMIVGTPRYMAPEQANGESVDHRCDLFSLGSVLYHVASGKAPFQGGNLTATLLAVAQADCTPIEQVCPKLHPDLANLIMRLLSKQREERPQSVAEVSEAIAKIERTLDAEPQPTFASLDDIDVSAVTTPLERDEPGQIVVATADGDDRDRGSRRKTVIWTWGLFGAIVAAVIITFVTAEGIVTINIPQKMEDDFEVNILSDNGEVVILNKANNWSVTISGGKYTLSLHGGKDTFKLKDDTLSVSRFGKSVIEIEYTRPPSPPEGWVDIFNGKTLGGWSVEGQGKWKVDQGLLVGIGNNSRLVYTKERFQDLEVRVECKINKDGNSGLFLRTQFGKGSFDGYEAQITNIDTGQNTMTGGIYNRTDFKKKLVDDDTWFTLKFLAKGDRLTVFINDKKTSETTDQKFKSGQIALQVWGKTTVVQFRTIQVRKLDK